MDRGSLTLLNTDRCLILLNSSCSLILLNICRPLTLLKYGGLRVSRGSSFAAPCIDRFLCIVFYLGAAQSKEDTSAFCADSGVRISSIFFV